MRHVVFAVAALALAAGPAAACLNDSEITSHEREFRAQYRGQPTPPQSTAPSVPVAYPALAVVGVVLAAGAVGLTVRATRAKA